MSEKIRKLLLGTALFIFFLYVLLPSEIFDPYLYDTCSIEYVDNKVDSLLEPKPRISEEKKQRIQEFEERLTKDGIPPEKHRHVKRAALKYTYLLKNQCPIPKETERALLVALEIEYNAGNKTCPENMFFEKNKELLQEFKKHKASYPKLEQAIYERLLKTIDSRKAEKFLAQKWQEPKARNDLIIKLLQVLDRHENQCKEVNLPLRPLITDIFRFYQQ